MTGPGATAGPHAIPAWGGPPDPDVQVPNVARIYDYLLGGKDHYAADRAAAKELLAAVPEAAAAARANRRFLGRAVWHLARDAGIRQFLDIGTGLPTQGNVHEIAHAASGSARVVYCDNDPLVTVHARALLAGDASVAAVHADLRRPRQLLALPELRAHLDLGEPVAVLLVAVLHFIEDREDPHAIVETVKDHLAPGSFVVISHVAADEISADAARQAADVYKNASAPGVARTKQDIARFFDGLDMVEPGLADVGTWRSEQHHVQGPALFYGGVGRKPDPAGRRAPRHPQQGTRSPRRPLTVMLDGQRLRQLRRQRGLSQEKLADLAGLSLTTVARLDQQENSPCRGRTLARLAAALGEEPAALLASQP